MKHLALIFSLMLGIVGSSSPASAAALYPWIDTYRSSESIAYRISVPPGYERITVAPDSFQDWLRHLPLHPGKSTVYLYNDNQKPSQQVHVAVVDIDVGTENLQQCADAIIRLRAEYLYAQKHYSDIHFNFTSGDTIPFTKWVQGYRPHVTGSEVQWKKFREESYTYLTFQEHLKTIFTYAGSYSLEQELHPVERSNEMQIGDVFIAGGFPGHAMIVVDMAHHTVTHKRAFLLAQSYMPAQSIHLVRNPKTEESANPWYALDFGEELHTPEWTFQKTQLKRFQ
jgi:hypothetical protein